MSSKSVAPGVAILLAGVLCGCTLSGQPTPGAVSRNVGPGSSASGYSSSDLGNSSFGNSSVRGAPSTNATIGN